MRWTSCSIALSAALLACAPAAQARDYERISDERTYTSWSHVTTGSVVRATPSHNGRRLGRVQTHTFIGSPEVVVVLGRSGGWSRVRYARLGAQVGWVPTRVLGPTHVSRSLITVNLRAQRLRAYRHGKLVLNVRVAIGAPASPTPRGVFFLREAVVPKPLTGPYGVLALGLNAFSPQRTGWIGGGQVAIHGTNQPGLIPGRVSNGCVRLRNADVRRLGRLVGLGTPVRVR